MEYYFEGQKEMDRHIASFLTLHVISTATVGMKNLESLILQWISPVCSLEDDNQFIRR
jgi:hypothetical protein